MLLGGLVGVGGRRGKAASETRRQQQTSVPSRPFSRHVTQVEMRFDPRRELKRSQATWEVSAGRRLWM